MLDRRRDDFVAALLRIERRKNRGVVGFVPARSEYDLMVEGRPEQRLQALARLLHRRRLLRCRRRGFEEAFPNCSEKYGNIAATTAGSARVVALLSR